MENRILVPDYLFEVSWEVCNKVGGIYTVIATKSLHLKSELGRHHILIGPDVWMDVEANPDFIEDPTLYAGWKAQAAAEGMRVRVGRWNVPGRPTAILIDYKSFIDQTDHILGQLWESFGVDSITGNWDYKESAIFGYAAGRAIESFYKYNLYASDKVDVSDDVLDQLSNVMQTVRREDRKRANNAAATGPKTSSAGPKSSSVTPKAGGTKK